MSNQSLSLRILKPWAKVGNSPIIHMRKQTSQVLKVIQMLVSDHRTNDVSPTTCGCHIRFCSIHQQGICIIWCSHTLESGKLLPGLKLLHMKSQESAAEGEALDTSDMNTTFHLLTISHCLLLCLPQPCR